VDCLHNRAHHSITALGAASMYGRRIAHSWYVAACPTPLAAQALRAALSEYCTQAVLKPAAAIRSVRSQTAYPVAVCSLHLIPHGILCGQ
jgi:hypothetical protein